MKKYCVTVDWSGYCRGYSKYEVEANNEEEAKEFWYDGELKKSVTVRDDSEKEAVSAKEISENEN